ncbi:potassium channel family protein [Trueperella sp. LYQ143]|uniref:potassium channel family protein n=1 Tax=unclassified Trueperella TaxID=2630174 RepID=UPI003983A645
MKLVIAGAGSVGRSIARSMIEQGHDVVLIDHKPEGMRVASVPEADWIMGDACELSVLNTAGVDDADVVVATTGDDKANLVMSLLCKTEFGVPRVIARVSNPANTWLFDETWGVDVAVSTPQIMSEIIEESISTGRIVRRLRLDANAYLYQGTVHPRAVMVGKMLSEIEFHPDIVMCAIIRDEIPITATPDVTIEGEDHLMFIVRGYQLNDHEQREARQEALQQMRELLNAATPTNVAAPEVPNEPSAT